MPLLHRMNLTQKFMILGLIAAVMVLLPSVMYFKRAMAVVSTAELEMRGTAPVVALNKVIQLTQTHRGMSAGMLNGNEALAGRRPVMRDAVVKAMDALDTELSKAFTTASRITGLRPARAPLPLSMPADMPRWVWVS